jgi:hypothetical protein
MPRERQSITHKFSIGGHEGYITAGMYADGSIGEIFLTDIGKEGSTLRGMMNSFATAISIALQYGVPLETLVQKFSYMRFEPEGITGNPEIPFAKSTRTPRRSSGSLPRRCARAKRPRRPRSRSSPLTRPGREPTQRARTAAMAHRPRPPSPNRRLSCRRACRASTWVPPAASAAA